MPTRTILRVSGKPHTANAHSMTGMPQPPTFRYAQHSGPQENLEMPTRSVRRARVLENNCDKPPYCGDSPHILLRKSPNMATILFFTPFCIREHRHDAGILRPKLRASDPGGVAGRRSLALAGAGWRWLALAGAGRSRWPTRPASCGPQARATINSRNFNARDQTSAKWARRAGATICYLRAF